MSFADTYNIRSSTPTFNDVATALDALDTRATALETKTQLLTSTSSLLTIDGGTFNLLIGSNKVLPSVDRGLWMGDATHRYYTLYSSGFADDGTKIISSGILNNTISSGAASPNVYINSEGVLKKIV